MKNVVLSLEADDRQRCPAGGGNTTQLGTSNLHHNISPVFTTLPGTGRRSVYCEQRDNWADCYHHKCWRVMLTHPGCMVGQCEVFTVRRPGWDWLDSCRTAGQCPAPTLHSAREHTEPLPPHNTPTPHNTHHFKPQISIWAQTVLLFWLFVVRKSLDFGKFKV